MGPGPMQKEGERKEAGPPLPSDVTVSCLNRPFHDEETEAQR